MRLLPTSYLLYIWQCIYVHATLSLRPSLPFPLPISSSPFASRSMSLFPSCHYHLAIFMLKFRNLAASVDSPVVSWMLLFGSLPLTPVPYAKKWPGCLLPPHVPLTLPSILPVPTEKENTDSRFRFTLLLIHIYRFSKPWNHLWPLSPSGRGSLPGAHRPQCGVRQRQWQDCLGGQIRRWIAEFARASATRWGL